MKALAFLLVLSGCCPELDTDGPQGGAGGGQGGQAPDLVLVDVLDAQDGAGGGQGGQAPANVQTGQGGAQDGAGGGFLPCHPDPEICPTVDRCEGWWCPPNADSSGLPYCHYTGSVPECAAIAGPDDPGPKN